VKVGLVIHSGREDTIAAARDASRTLTERGVDVVAVGRAAEARDTLGPSPLAPEVRSADPGSFAVGLDLALSFGGDGTFLRAAHLCRDVGVPVLGLNLGRLGFLTEVEREDLSVVVDAIVRGEFEVEERRTLEVRVDGGPEDWALNEVSVEKSARQRVLLMSLHVAGTMFSRVPADAFVVASSTGSTAYAFSAGGPILSPDVSAIVVTPVAPHSAFSRSLVVAEHEEIRVEVHPDQEPAVMSCDGRSPVTVPAGTSVFIRGGGLPVRLVRVGPRDFYERIRLKFGLQ
jgi:NAD+ kinase